MSKPKDLKVCMFGAEVAPYAVRGELSEVLRGLPLALSSLGVETSVFAPLHASVMKHHGVEKLFDLKPIPIGDTQYHGSVYADRTQNPVRNYFIACPRLFGRVGIYQDPATGQDYQDNFERFDYFALAGFEALRILDWQPDLIHCHDSHTALLPAYLKLVKMGEPFFSGISSILTLYDLSYHAQYEGEKFHLTALPQELFYPLGPFEYYEKLSTLKAGICYADALNTVSHQYAREIQTPEFGSGLEEVIQRRKDQLQGILNGIDIERWNPETDSLIQGNFSRRNLLGKKVNKEALQDHCAFALRDVPLIGMVVRNQRQDGTDLFVEAWERLKTVDCQWVILGEQLQDYSRELQDISLSNQEKFAFFKSYDERLIHLVHAGCDLFLMPSRSQPCGMHHMCSMRYGTIPVVRHAGGLVETVKQFDKVTGLGHGFKFYSLEPDDLARVIERAVRMWRTESQAWEILMGNAMSQDFSWEGPAREYASLYRKTVSHGG